MPKNGVASARPSTGSSLSSGGSVMPGSRIGPFAMPACPLQPDLDLLHKFRQKENEYSRERNASPFRWIDRYSQKRRPTEPLADCDDSSDEDFEDLLGEGGNPAHSSSRSVARELIRYEPRQIQPAKLAEKLAREYKKWHTEMTVKLEEKKAESKRKGNKNDFSLSTTPRQDKKKKDSFSRKSSAPDKLSINEHSPRQPRTRPDTSSPRKSARDKGKETKMGEGWAKPPLGKSLSNQPSLTSHVRSSSHDPHKGAPVRQPEFEDGESGNGGGGGGGRQQGGKTKDPVNKANTAGDNSSSTARKKLTQSSGTVSVDAGTLRQVSDSGKDVVLLADDCGRSGSGGSSTTRHGHTRSPVLTDDAGASSSSPPAPGGVNGHDSIGGGGNDEEAAMTERSRLEGSGSGGSTATEQWGEAMVDAGAVVVEKEKEKEKDKEKEKETRGEGSFLASLKSMANRTKAAKRKSATTSDLPAMMNTIDVNAANAARAGLNNENGGSGGGYDSEGGGCAAAGGGGRMSARDKRERSDSGKDKLRGGRSGSDGGKGKEKEKGEPVTNATSTSSSTSTSLSSSSTSSSSSSSSSSPATVHLQKADVNKKALGKKSLSKRANNDLLLKNS